MRLGIVIPVRGAPELLASCLAALGQSTVVPHEILVIASRLKAYVRARSGFNTADSTIDALSDRSH